MKITQFHSLYELWSDYMTWIQVRSRLHKSCSPEAWMLDYLKKPAAESLLHIALYRPGLKLFKNTIGEDGELFYYIVERLSVIERQAITHFSSSSVSPLKPVLR